MIKKFLEEHNKIMNEFVLQNEDKIYKLAEELKSKLKGGATIFVVGNGGSMSDSLHMVTELMGKFFKERKPIKAISLGTNPSLISAVSNDYSFEKSFVRELEGLADEGDIFIAISTSGRSKNVLEALKLARRIGCYTVSFVGNDKSEVSEFSNVVISVPSDVVPRIQECHIFLIHIICQMLEEKLYEN